jgi:2-methylisocitrate lyase-like PEP mutase family enzyme
MPGAAPVADLAAAGVSRVSVGGGFAFVALGAAVIAGRELLDNGTYGFWETGKIGAQAAHSAFES